MFKKIGLLLLLISICIQAFAYEVTPHLDRTEIHQGESFQLIFTINGKYGDIDPDFSELNENFTVLGTSTSTQMTIVNNRSSMITDFNITLLPKKLGIQTIPSIKFGKKSTKPLKIKVLKPKKFSNRISGDRAFIDASIDNASPYVQSQIVYTVRLYYNTNINNYHLTDPHLNNAVVFRLGEDKQYQTELKNKSFQVLERRYAIYPQESGQFNIQPPVLTGFQVDRRIDYRGFYNLNNTTGKPIKLVAPSKKIRVKAIPKSNPTENWLPAKRIILSQSWTHSADEFKTGDPITRTITITATGLTAAQLPELSIEKDQNFHTYRDKAKLSNTLDRDNVVASRVEKIAYIPLADGNLKLPAINIHWWNTETDKPEVAVIPGKIFKVLPSSVQTKKPQLIPKVKAQPKPKVIITQVSTNPWWLYAAIATLASLWLITLMVWWLSAKRRKKSKPIIVTTPTPQPSARDIKQRLRQACEMNDYQQAKKAILLWAKETWPEEDIHNCRTLALQLGDSPLARACIELDAILYAPHHKAWDGNLLWEAFKCYKVQTPHEQKESVLPPLYPN